VQAEQDRCENNLFDDDSRRQFPLALLDDVVCAEDVEKAVMFLRVGKKMQLKDALERFKGDGSLAHFESLSKG